MKSIDRVKATLAKGWITSQQIQLITGLSQSAVSKAIPAVKEVLDLFKSSQPYVRPKNFH